jgi:hypothetical protein
MVLIGSNVSVRVSGGGESCPLSWVNVRKIRGPSGDLKVPGGGGRPSWSSWRPSIAVRIDGRSISMRARVLGIACGN